jgi:thioredoxin-related protein
MRYLILILLLAFTAVPARAAELLMFEEEWCEWCERWNEEIGVIYDKTDEGQRAPLRRIDIHGAFPDVELALRPHYTPTFVLIENGREIGRIEGYPGEDFFWGLLGQLLERLPKQKTKTGI